MLSIIYYYYYYIVLINIFSHVCSLKYGVKTRRTRGPWICPQ